MPIQLILQSLSWGDTYGLARWIEWAERDEQSCCWSDTITSAHVALHLWTCIENEYGSQCLMDRVVIERLYVGRSDFEETYKKAEAFITLKGESFRNDLVDFKFWVG
ncbi:hypothetical protein [Rhizobium sp. ZW T2_16]|uniref:hypothetical protein n=1 Tax=Rhizobium sp. ZW T2_16 TaxID=3378083 RepID=UPI00385250A6